MGIEDRVEKAKDALSDNPDLLDKAADAIKSRTDDSVDEKIDMAVDKAKDFLGGDKA